MRCADNVIFTSDNPRSEDPHTIINDMVGGSSQQCYQVEVNRELAIYQAISEASAGDVVLVAGKGHEAYQEIKAQKIPMSDVAIVRQILSDLSDRKRGRV